MKRTDVVATTHIDRQYTRITKEALEKAAEDIRTGNRLLLTVEHDLSIPPYGKGINAWVEPREDGEFQLIVESDVFEDEFWFELDDRTLLFRQESKIDNFPFLDRYAEMNEDLFLSYDWVNFASKEDLKAFVEAVKIPSNLEI